MSLTCFLSKQKTFLADFSFRQNEVRGAATELGAPLGTGWVLVTALVWVLRSVLALACHLRGPGLQPSSTNLF